MPEGPNISPSMGKRRNPELALEIHMINTRAEAGGGGEWRGGEGGALKFLFPGPL